MKLKILSLRASGGGSLMLASGFTLPEILIATTVLVLVVAGILAANLFGMRMVQANETKLSATEWSRNTFGKITDQIRTCNSISILNADTNDNFTALLPGEAQQGNALQIFPSTNSGSFTMYFVNLSDETFRQTVAISGVSTNTVILADSVTNAIIFSAQDFSGNVLNNNQNNQVIHLTLDFYQPASYMQNSYYYQLETSVTPRIVQ